MHWDIRVFELVARPLEFLSSVKLRCNLLKCDKNTGILFPTKQGNRSSSREEEGNPGLFFSFGGTLGVPLEWRLVCLGTS